MLEDFQELVWKPFMKDEKEKMKKKIQTTHQRKRDAKRLKTIHKKVSYLLIHQS